MSATIVRPLQLEELLVACIKGRLPVLVKGAPGVGKTDIIGSATEKAGADLLVSHPVTADPTDAKGLPWKVDGQDLATFLPFGDLALAMSATRPLVWDLEDLGQATPATQASFMQLLLARRVNGHKLPDCVTFLATTNRRQDRAGVSGILEPVKSRFAAIVELQPSVDDWVQWALVNDMPAELIAFMRLRGHEGPDGHGLLHHFEPNQDIVNQPCPRTWAHVGRLFNLGLPKPLQLPAFAGAVGEAAAGEFIAKLRLFEEAPDPDHILLDPEGAPIPSEEHPAARYAVVSALAAKATPKNFGSVSVYAQRLYGAGAGEFATLLIRDSIRRDMKITQCLEYQKLATTEVAAAIFETRTEEK